MRARYAPLAILLLSSGRASTGQFVSSGSVDYATLMTSLGCEVKTAFERSEKAGGALTPTDKWQAFATVIFEGALKRNAGVTVGVAKLPLGSKDNLMTASAGLNR